MLHISEAEGKVDKLGSLQTSNSAVDSCDGGNDCQ